MSYPLRSSKPVARKGHACSTCYGPIYKGERYDRAVLLGDDGLYEWLTCPRCFGLSSCVLAWLADAYEGYTPDDVSEWAREHLSDPEHGSAAAAYLRRREAAWTEWLARIKASDDEADA